MSAKNNGDRKVVFVNGKAVWETKKMVEEVTHEAIGDPDLALVSNYMELVSYLLDRGLPFTQRTPGTPVRGRAFDRYLVTVFAERTIRLEAFTQEGLAKQAVVKLVGVGDPGVTIYKALHPDYRACEIKSLKDLVSSCRKDDEDAVRLLKAEFRDGDVAPEWEDQNLPGVA